MNCNNAYISSIHTMVVEKAVETMFHGTVTFLHIHFFGFSHKKHIYTKHVMVHIRSLASFFGIYSVYVFIRFRKFMKLAISISISTCLARAGDKSDRNMRNRRCCFFHFSNLLCQGMSKRIFQSQLCCQLGRGICISVCINKMSIDLPWHL